MTDLEFLERSNGRLAYRRRSGREPTILFIPGYGSDMEGTKAVALDAWAASQSLSMLRFDLSGCGLSDGEFEQQTLTSWLDDLLEMIDRLTQGPLLLVGSSMGGWLMLLAALARRDRVAALVGIAAAPDFTDWGYTDAEKQILLSAGRLEQPSPYSDTPTVTSRELWESGAKHMLLQGPLDLSCPVRLLHGLADTDVPWRISLQLMEQLRSSDVQAILVKEGEHRLSRDGDIALLIATVTRLMERL